MTIHTKVAGTWRSVGTMYAKVAGAWKPATAVYERVGGRFRLVHPTTGTPKIVGVRYGDPHRPAGPPLPPGSTIYPGSWPTGGVPYYLTCGDRSQIASAKVEVAYTTANEKTATNQSVSWDCPVGWGIWLVLTPADSGWSSWVAAAMTDAEGAALGAQAIQVWSPREGGSFCYYPACWEATTPSALPIFATDTWSFYGTVPPGVVSATAQSSYAYADAYEDMSAGSGYGSTRVTYSTFKVTLKNSGGTVLDTWTGSLAPPAAMSGRMRMAAAKAFFWPEGWRGLFGPPMFDVPNLSVEYAGDEPSGAASWRVSRFGEEVGGFTLAMRPGVPDTVEIHRVNLDPGLVGQAIMRTVVHHGTVWSPARYVSVQVPDEPTKRAMLGWGWSPPSEGYLAARPLTDRQRGGMDRVLVFDTHTPMLNRFSELGWPTAEEVTGWDG